MIKMVRTKPTHVLTKSKEPIIIFSRKYNLKIRHIEWAIYDIVKHNDAVKKKKIPDNLEQYITITKKRIIDDAQFNCLEELYCDYGPEYDNYYLQTDMEEWEIEEIETNKEKAIEISKKLFKEFYK